MSDGALAFKALVDTALFDRATLRYAQDLGLSFPKAVRQSARLLNAELLRFTPPKTQAQGRKAVARDIGRAMWLLDPKKIHNSILAAAVRDGEHEVVEAFINALRRRGKAGALGTHQLKHFSPSLHQSARNNRGRVTSRKRIMVIEGPEYKRYVKEVQSHVGALKFGWAISGRQLGVSIPAWVLGHSERQGSFQEVDSPTNPKVVMTNKAPGVENLGLGFIQRMIDRRTRAMTRDVEQILAGRTSRYF